MPQVKHGSPKDTIQPQGGIPRATWVPIPVGLGVSERAVTRTASSTRATPAAAKRGPRGDR